MRVDRSSAIRTSASSHSAFPLIRRSMYDTKAVTARRYSHRHDQVPISWEGAVKPLRGDHLAGIAWDVARRWIPAGPACGSPSWRTHCAAAGYDVSGDNPRSTLGSALNRAQHLWERPRYATWVWVADDAGGRPEVPIGISGLDLSRAAREAAKRLDPERRGLDHATILTGLARAGIEVRGPNQGQTLLNALWRQVDFERLERGRWRWL